jgi:hypothetical protein
MDGKPFFVVSQAVDPGLLQVLECDIVPPVPMRGETTVSGNLEYK